MSLYHLLAYSIFFIESNEKREKNIVEI